MYTEKPLGGPDTGRLTPEELGRWLQRCQALPGLRTEKIQTIRQQLRGGYYDTAERLDETIERLTTEISIL